MDVVCAILFQKQKLLLARKPRAKSPEGHWEFPGGKVEPGESYHQAINRELAEELGFTSAITRWHSLGSIDQPPWRLHFFMAELNQTYKPQEHPAVSWVPLEQLPLFKLSAGDSKALLDFKEPISKVLRSKV